MQRVYENGRRPAGVSPTDWDGADWHDGCVCYKAGRNGRPLDEDSRCVASIHRNDTGDSKNTPDHLHNMSRIRPNAISNVLLVPLDPQGDSPSPRARTRPDFTPDGDVLVLRRCRIYVHGAGGLFNGARCFIMDMSG
jgi:hypothetical protein